MFKFSIAAGIDKCCCHKCVCWVRVMCSIHIKRRERESEGDRKKGGITHIMISFGVTKPCDKYVCEQNKTIHTHE